MECKKIAGPLGIQKNKEDLFLMSENKKFFL
jgi:hypothetical protein